MCCVGGCRTDWLLRQFDEDGDGYLTFEDLRRLIERLCRNLQLPPVDDSVLRVIFDAFDSEHRQKLDVEEFCRLYWELLGRIRDKFYPTRKMLVRRSVFVGRRNLDITQTSIEGRSVCGAGGAPVPCVASKLERPLCRGMWTWVYKHRMSCYSTIRAFSFMDFTHTGSRITVLSCQLYLRFSIGSYFSNRREVAAPMFSLGAGYLVRLDERSAGALSTCFERSSTYRRICR